MPEKHTILGGKVHVYRRDNSSLWQCSTYLAGKNRRVSTKEDGLAKAKDFAEDWFLGLRGKVRNGEITGEKTFREAAVQFEREYQIITEGQRNAEYVQGRLPSWKPFGSCRRGRSNTATGCCCRGGKRGLCPRGSCVSLA